MVIAKFYFKPQFAEEFICRGKEGQTVVEMEFSSPYELIDACEEFKEFLLNCTALVDGKIIDLMAKSEL